MEIRSRTTLGRSSIALLALAFLAGCGQEAPDAEERPTGPRTVASFDGVPVAYEAHGSGAPALVLVHGWSCDRSYWDAQVEPLLRDYRVVTLDLAGHGDSGLARDAWTMEAFGRDAAAVVEELGLERVVLVGHSMGGDVILEAARRLPERVEGLVWVDTYRELGSPRSPEEVEERLAPLREDFEKGTRAFVRGMFPPDADDSLVAQVAEDMSSAPPEVALPSLESAITFEPEALTHLEELEAPVASISPDDPSVDAASLEEHGVGVHPVPDVGHFIQMEAPEAFNDTLRRVVQGFVR